MTIQGKMLLGGADYVPLNLYGVGVFMAFSGNGTWRNNASCAAVKGDGPLPPGKYWIVERGSGGFLSRTTAQIKDTFNSVVYGTTFGRDEWFALYRDEIGIDDTTWVNSVQRGLFRLHPGMRSEGCITIPHDSDYKRIRDALMSTAPVLVPCMRNLMARGCIEVIDLGWNSCT